ncbi:MAG: chemotaxis protein CheX [Sulfurimonas sp.]|nr:chemotaxis protein CheX [Sulfurimonas sp.]
MRAILKDAIGLFAPQGFLDGNNSAFFLNDEDIKIATDLNADMILVSLKKVIFFNKNGLDVFVKLFLEVKKKKNITVGFCDYDNKKFTTILKFYSDEMNFSLFKSYSIASLFSSSFKNKNKNVLLYSDDKSQKTAMAIELHDFGHNPIVCQTLEEFKEKSLNNGAYDDIINDTFIGQVGQKIATRVSGNAVIYSVSLFLDTEISNAFNIVYHNNSLNVGFRLFIFDACKVISMNIHALNFFSKLSSSAAEYSATICFTGLDFTKIPVSFKETMEDSGILFYEKMDDILLNKELLKELGASCAANIKSKRVLNKDIVSKLPSFVEATVATIEMMTNSKAKKEAIQINKIEIREKDNKIASSIGFYGDVDGMIILVFPTKIAKKACELLIGESTDDAELILDTLAELVNIVGGKIKSLLGDHGSRVNITLPRTYNNIDDLLEVIEDKKGVQVDLIFDDDKFLFFLTK